jgi:ribosome production factor 1
LTADLSASTSTAAAQQQPTAEAAADIASDPFASYFSSTDDPTIPPKVLITTSPKATRTTYEFCDELVGIFPGAEFHRRPKTRGFEMGKIAGWAAGRGFTNLMVVNENMKKPSAYPTPFTSTSVALGNHSRRCYNLGTLTGRTHGIL